MSTRLAGLHPQVRARAVEMLDWLGQFNFRPEVTSGFRSLSEQARLRRLWEQGKSRFPANRPGDSAHNFGLAFDAVLPADVRGRPEWEAWWKAYREWWGFDVPSNDSIHAEVPGWRRFTGR